MTIDELRAYDSQCQRMELARRARAVLGATIEQFFSFYQPEADDGKLIVSRFADIRRLLETVSDLLYQAVTE